MNNKKIFAGVLGALALMTVSTAAQASITLDPIPGTHDITADLTVVPVGTTGLFDVSTDISGLMPGNSVLTFDYGLGTGITGHASMSSTFNLSANPITATADTGTPFGSASVPIGYVTANLSLPLSATTVIGNNSSPTISFHTVFEGLIAGGIPTLTYTLSSVPLPPALTMFVTGLLGLFGFSAMRRKNALSAI